MKVADMGWHEAYLTQARSEYAIMEKLGKDVEDCHRLHYLQMVTEKLSKAMLTPPGSKEPAKTSHVMFVRMLRTLKSSPEFRRQLGFTSVFGFNSYIDSLLDMAGKIERLSPDQAGLTQPNPEYPWRDNATQQVLAPSDYSFPGFDPHDFKMIRIKKLVNSLLFYLLARTI